MRKTYCVIACPKCQQFLLAHQGVKSKTCPYCGGRMDLSRIEVLWRTVDIEEARRVLRSMREDKPK